MYSLSKTWERELKSLLYLDQKSNLYPNIIDFGFGANSEKWLLLNKLSGRPLYEVMESINHVELEWLYFQIGEYHARLHNECRMERFYDWATSSPSFKHYKNYQEFEIEKNRRRADRLI